MPNKPSYHGRDHRGLDPATGTVLGADAATLIIDSTENVDTPQGVGSFGASSGHVLTADGSGGSMWTDPTGDGGAGDFAVFETAQPATLTDLGSGLIVPDWSAILVSTGTGWNIDFTDNRVEFGLLGTYSVFLNMAFETPVNAKTITCILTTYYHSGSWTIDGGLKRIPFTPKETVFATGITNYTTYQAVLFNDFVGDDFGFLFAFQENDAGNPVTAVALSALVTRLA